MGMGVPKHRVIRQEEMASSCSGGGLAWLLGKISLLRVERYWNRQPRGVVESPLRRHSKTM